MVAGWLVAAWQVSLGFGIGLPLVYFLLGAGLVVAARFAWSRVRTGRWPAFGRRLLVADLCGGVFFAGVCVWLGTVFLRVVDLNPQAKRDLSWTKMFSPPLRGFFVAPADSWLWGEWFAGARAKLTWPPEMALLPGVTLIGLAVMGLVVSVFPVRHRVALGLGVLATVALGLGANLGDGDPGYLTLSRLLPGWDALRTPGRLMVWTSLLLAVLAAGAVTELAAQFRTPATGPGSPPAGAGGAADPAGDAGRTDTVRAASPGEAHGPATVAAGPDAAATVPPGGSSGAATIPTARAPLGAESPAVPVTGLRPAVPDGAALRSAVPAAKLRLAVPMGESQPAGRAAIPEPVGGPGRGGPERGGPGPVARVLLLIPLLLVLLEGVNQTPHPVVPTAPAAFRAATGPMLVLPSDGLFELHVMLWSTDGYPKVANGLAAFVPTGQQRIRDTTVSFPDPASVAFLRETGIRTVVVFPDRLAGTAWEGVPARPVDGLGITREEIDGALVYRLDQPR
ncbi:hypothetical protein GCM10027605_13220 [Micromonospora zhanjiangensis]